MIGYKELIQDRIDGYIPPLLYIDLDIPPSEPSYGRLQLETKDTIGGTSLAAVQGLVVAISGFDEKKVKACADLAEKSGAKRVIATIHKKRNDTESEVIEVQDSQGVLTWKC